MRKVMVLTTERQEDRSYKNVDKGEALFHQFGSDYEEFESGGCTYSTAIVEWPSGTVESVGAHMIRFLTPPEVADRNATK